MEIKMTKGSKIQGMIEGSRIFDPTMKNKICLLGGTIANKAKVPRAMRTSCSVGTMI